MKNTWKHLGAYVCAIGSSVVNVMVSIMVIIAVPFLSSCHDDDDEADETQGIQTNTYKIAVIMPGDQMDRWKFTADWALRNIQTAYAFDPSISKRVNLELEWYDENNEAGLISFVQHVEADPAYKAIIGPLRTNNAYKVAMLCEKHHKPLLLPQCTSTEVQRIFAESHNVFNLTQSDIGQAEVMVSMALARHAPSVSLLVNCGDVTTAEGQRSYGATFRNWVGFLACEAGLAVDTVCTYDDTESMKRAIEGLTQYYSQLRALDEATERSVLLFVPEKSEELIVYDSLKTEYANKAGKGDFYPFTLCSNSAVSDEATLAKLHDDYEGIDIAPDATSGFTAAYKGLVSIDANPIGGEPQLFDAIYLLAFALTYNPDNVSDAIVEISDCEDGDYYYTWQPFETAVILSKLSQGNLTTVSGVLGRWQFDKRYHASLLNTTYKHWRLKNNAFHTLQYITLGGSRRSVNNEQLWTMNAKVNEFFTDEVVEQLYGTKDGNYAVIVAASTGWHNYRHQADALDIYQMLKQSGYDDDHILLIMEGDILNDKYNLHKGEVRVSPDGENLYHDVVVDYRMSTLTPNDVSNILRGEVTERTPVVLNSTAKDNVFFFWSGHGNEGVFYLDHQNMTSQLMSNTLWEMFNRKFRKMFFVIEACYSGSVAEYCLGVPGLLMLTAANGSETSLADVLDPEMNIWLSNGFTRSFCEALRQNNNISMRDLYYHVARQTVGSHATMYNYQSYGNMFTSTVKEFLP